MYPIFKSKWLITMPEFYKFRHGSYTIVKKMKFCTGLQKLQIPNANNLDAMRSPKRLVKKSLYIAISFCIWRSEGIGACPIFKSK